ncbi:MAG: DUF1643 domain-containing protein [Clostridia bacterium]|nr:DUF1643 domain-containing protein [Clostridia bacterium]
MKTIETNLQTTAVFSDNGTKRYLLKKTWDEKKPSLTIIMLAPSEASGIELDNTTLLVLNNASRLGFGSVSIVNLFATLNDFTLSKAEAEDSTNTNMIVNEANTSDTVVYAPGVGKVKNIAFQERAKQVLQALRPAAKKLKCITSRNGLARMVHPLTPAVREWVLEEMTIEEALQLTSGESKKEKHTTAKKKKNS